MPAPSTTKNMKMPCAHNWSRVIHSPAAITAIRIAMLVTDLFKEGGPDAEKLVQGKSSGSMIASRPCSVMTVPLSPLKRISDGMPDTLNRCCSAFTLLSPCGNVCQGIVSKYFSISADDLSAETNTISNFFPFALRNERNRGGGGYA